MAIHNSAHLIGNDGKLAMAIASRRIRILNIKTLMFLMLFTTATKAFAMNQEGHDNWMTDLPHAIALLEAIPEARPLPSRKCPVTPSMLARNPYEQIPLPRHRCPRDQLPTRIPASPVSTE